MITLDMVSWSPVKKTDSKFEQINIQHTHREKHNITSKIRVEEICQDVFCVVECVLSVKENQLFLLKLLFSVC